MTPDATQRFATLDGRLVPDDYNYEQFRTPHYLLDARGTAEARGIAPGEEAPDWALPDVRGGTLRLTDLRGTPVLLHFGSLT